MTRATLVLTAALFLGAAGASADTGLEQRLTAAVARVLPDVAVTAINPGPIGGIYEVMLGPTVLYISGDGKFIFKGDVFDLQSLDNVTAKRRGAARMEAFAEIGADTMIEFAPAGDTKRTIYVYTDIDCGYCRKMHLEVGELNAAGIAVRYLAYPRSGIGGESYDKAVAVWCSKDRGEALTASKSGKTLKAATCQNPVEAQYHLGEAMGVRGTPAVYSDTGESIGGYVPAKELIRMLGMRQG
ncbi:MAG: DsbC family protein [Gammaproteobacteria bacterium]|jgi:thiol:disulfide interchange protein DsbC